MKLKDIFLKRAFFFPLNIFLAVVTLFLVLLIIRDFFPLSRTIDLKNTPAERQKAGVQDNKKLEDYAIILKNNLFGFDAGQLTALSSAAGKKEGTVGVNYKLVGTISAGDKNSFAIFLSPDGKQALFRVKSDIPGLGFLEKVEPFRIIIKGDKISEMKLADIKGMERVVNVSAPAHAGASSRTSGDEFVKEVGDGAYVLNQKMVQESINNPQRLMTDARLLPLYRNGKQEGFALNEVKPGGIYDSLGLKNGDVLLRINEYNITNPEAALQAFTALRGVDRLQLDIQRNNTAITMTYDIK